MSQLRNCSALVQTMAREVQRTGPEQRCPIAEDDFEGIVPSLALNSETQRVAASGQVLRRPRWARRTLVERDECHWLLWHVEKQEFHPAIFATVGSDVGVVTASPDVFFAGGIGDSAQLNGVVDWIIFARARCSCDLPDQLVPHPSTVELILHVPEAWSPFHSHATGVFVEFTELVRSGRYMQTAPPPCRVDEQEPG